MTTVKQIDAEINFRTLQWAGGHQNLLMQGWWNGVWFEQSARCGEIKIRKISQHE